LATAARWLDSSRFTSSLNLAGSPSPTVERGRTERDD
jgi:hypothetical protein